MTEILRRTQGFSALPETHPLAELNFGNPFKFATWMEDFLAYDITQAIGGNPWTFTATNCVDTILGPTGVLVMTLGGADNDVGQLQLAESPIQLTAGKKLFFQARFNLELASGGTVAANEMFVGLATEQTTTNFMNSGGTALAVDNALGFVKFDAGASMAAVMRTSDAESTNLGVLTPVSAQYFTVSIYYDGTSSYFYVANNADGSDGVLKATFSGTHPTAVLNPTLFVKAGEAKANILNVDYLFVARER